MNSQELRALQESYSQVYEQETGRGPRISDTYDMRDAEGGPKGGGTIKGPKKKNVIRKEETDLYDIILSHLLDEGYAETQEAAEAIMVNMSEDWRESIVEATYKPRGAVEPVQPADTRMTVTNVDKKGNTKAWQNYKAGNKSYKASSHLE
jgi:hypothetical protein